MAPGPCFLHWLQPHLLAFHIHLLAGPFSYFHSRHYTFNRFIFSRPGRLTTFLPLGGKVIVWVCAGPRSSRLSARDRRRSPRCWFQSPTGPIKPWFFTEGKLLLATSTPRRATPRPPVCFSSCRVTARPWPPTAAPARLLVVGEFYYL